MTKFKLEICQIVYRQNELADYLSRMTGQKQSDTGVSQLTIDKFPDSISAQFFHPPKIA